MTVKERYQAIQTKLKVCGEEGCLFLSLLSIAEEISNKQIDLITAYNIAIENKYMLQDFYMLNQEGFIAKLVSKPIKKEIFKSLPDQVPNNMYTIEKWYNPRTRLIHFRRRVFDTLENSTTVKEGYIKEYYCYSIMEG